MTNLIPLLDSVKLEHLSVEGWECNLPLSIGPPRSSSLRDSSSLKARFLWRRPGVNPQMGLSTGRATSTSWVISANRITSWAKKISCDSRRASRWRFNEWWAKVPEFPHSRQLWDWHRRPFWLCPLHQSSSWTDGWVWSLCRGPSVRQNSVSCPVDQ